MHGGTTDLSHYDVCSLIVYLSELIVNSPVQSAGRHRGKLKHLSKTNEAPKPTVPLGN